MLRMKLGVGWGGDDNILCTCTHCWCYATSCFLHLHTWSVLRNIMFLALAHMVGATQHHGVGWGWGGVGWGGDDNILCISTHGWCYATSCFLHLHTWSVLRNIMFLALAHMVGATQHHVLGQNSVNLFRRLVGDEVCKERCDSYVLTAGDNCAEGLCVVSKKQLRRTNLNIAVVQDKIQHRYLLSSHFFKQSSRLGTHHASTAVPQNEMHVWLGVSHRCFQKTFVATLTHVLQEKRLTVMLLGPQIHCK